MSPQTMLRLNLFRYNAASHRYARDVLILCGVDDVRRSTCPIREKVRVIRET